MFPYHPEYPRCGLADTPQQDGMGFDDLLFAAAAHLLPSDAAAADFIPAPSADKVDATCRTVAAPCRIPAVCARKRTPRRDRHSKIVTAKGPRDRRMRLSLDVAKQFFDLQDELGFDKASKTVEWLLTKSSDAIKTLSAGRSRPADLREVSSAGTTEAKTTTDSSTSSECEVDSAPCAGRDKDRGAAELLVEEEEEVEDDDDEGAAALATASSCGGLQVGLAARAKRALLRRPPRRPAADPALAKESRAKARVRARERTMEKKMMMRGNAISIDDGGGSIPQWVAASYGDRTRLAERSEEDIDHESLQMMVRMMAGQHVDGIPASNDDDDFGADALHEYWKQQSSGTSSFELQEEGADHHQLHSNIWDGFN